MSNPVFLTSGSSAKAISDIAYYCPFNLSFTLPGTLRFTLAVSDYAISQSHQSDSYKPKYPSYPPYLFYPASYLP